LGKKRRLMHGSTYKEIGQANDQGVKKLTKALRKKKKNRRLVPEVTRVRYNWEKRGGKGGKP